MSIFNFRWFKAKARCAVLVAVACACPALAADITEPKTFDIKPQRMDRALVDFSKQAGFQVVADSAGIEKLQTRGVSGTRKVSAAMEELLAGSGLSYRVIEPNVIVVERSDARGGASSTGPIVAQASGSLSDVHKAESIVVTAQKREERLKEVPISISVLGGLSLDKSPFEGVTEALRTVPGVTTNVAVQSGGTQLAVRGVAAANPVFTGSSPIAYYFDHVPLGLVKTAIFPDANVYDLERIEALRGPHGTLYGASALNGVIRVLTKDPNLDQFEFKGRVSASSTQYGGPNYRGDLALNVPLVEGKLAARAVVGFEDWSGWIDRPGTANANDSRIGNYRLKLSGQPTDKLSIVGSVWASRSDSGAPPFSGDNRQINRLLDESLSTDYDIYNVKISYDAGSFSVLSATGYIDYRNPQFNDLSIFGGQRGINLFEGKVFSEEVNLTSKRSGPWRWSLGGIYRDAKDRNFQEVPGLAPAPALLDTSEHSKSYAVFGELTHLLLGDRLELTGGLRYFKDELTSREDKNLGGTPAAGDYAQTTFNATTPRIVLTWRPGEQMFYASYSQGFRSGFTQNPSITALGFAAVKPDKLTNYEIGMKGTLWGRRMEFETAVFYIDWKDTQQSLLVPFANTFQTVGVNSKSASGVGYEFAALVRPIDRLLLSANFSWNDLTFDEDVVSRGILLFPRGTRPNFSSRYTAGGSAEYSFPLGGSGLTGRASASVNRISGVESRRLFGTNVVALPGGPTTIGQISISIEPPGNQWTGSIFANNVNNEQRALMNNWLGVADYDVRVRPRTVGVQLSYRY